MSHPRLATAPITEALIDVHLSEPLDEASRDAFRDSVREEFPDCKNIFELSFQMGEEQSIPSPSQQNVSGYQLWSSDKKKVLQVRKDGLAISHLKPYDNWDSLKSDAVKYWGILQSYSGPGAVVNRYTVRFLNRIELPLQGLEFERYLRVFPSMSPKLPQTLIGLFMRIAWPIDGATAIVTESFDPPQPGSNILPFILDIDVSEIRDFAAGSAALWNRVDELRRIKNDVFFGALTDAAKDLFK